MFKLGKRQVRLGDYTQPLDAKNFTWGRRDEYCEPYVAEQIIQEAAKRKQADEARESRNMDVTKVEKPLTDSPSKSLNSTNTADIIKNPDDGYDHAQAWKDSGQNGSVPKRDAKGGYYEEPWDLKKKQNELQNKFQRCQSEEFPSNLMTGMEQRRYSHDRVAMRRRVPAADMYEDAWDTTERQRQLEEKITAAQRGSAASPARSSASPSSPHTSPPPHAGKILYEEPWDIKKKQKDLESRMSAARIQGTPSEVPMSPTRKTLDTYEEAWDLRAKAFNFLPGNPQELSTPMPPPSPSAISPTHRLGKPSPPCAVGERINPIIPLQKQRWYHGRISRGDAESMLRVCKDGSYLVRESESEKGQYSLSIKSRIMNIHLRIHKKSNNKFILGENSSDFCSIPEMIDHYTHNPVPLKGADHLTLLHPVEKS